MIKDTSFLPDQDLSAFQKDQIRNGILFFDIETTGLSASRNQIYCIGCGFRRGNGLQTELLFAESPAEEEAVIQAFLERLNEADTVVTYNGTTFDLPFLRKKTQSISADIFAGKTHIDLYRYASSLKKLLSLKSCRQKSIEAFLNLQRTDPFSGEELIDAYYAYCRDPSPSVLQDLFLHNREDVNGMYAVYELLIYHRFFNGGFQIKQFAVDTDQGREMLLIRLISNDTFPQNVSYQTHDITLRIKSTCADIQLPVYYGELKRFFPDYKDYYYLPEEDTAIHKSLGAYVDSSHREKATRKTCYTKQNCSYIMYPGKKIQSSLRSSYDDRNIYLDLRQLSGDTLYAFLLHVFPDLLK